MIVQPIQLATLDWAAAAAGTLARPWKVGSTVSVRVLEQTLGARLILQINGLTVEADPLSNGLVPRQFQAKVIANGPQPVLELLGQSAARSSPTAPALRALLPQQGGLQPLLADLRALARTSGARALPEPVRVALARLEASIADRHDMLDPAVLRDTLKRGGTQLEYTLLQHANTSRRLPATQIDYDMKAALQRLSQALHKLPQNPGTAQADTPATPAQPAAPPPIPARFAEALAMATALAPTPDPAPTPAPTVSTTPAAADTPPPLLQLPLQPQARLPAPDTLDAFTLAGGMLKHVQAALSRIEIMQLEAHPSASPQAWMIEVPVRDDDGFDVLQLRFEEEAGGDQADATPQWTLGFTLDPPGLGAIHGQIRLRGVQVTVDLWAQHDAAVLALEEQTSVLSQLLEGSGLQLAQLRVRQGTPLRHTGLGHALLEASA
ncbi:MAG: flagellar hook-length control protein FliK [Xanthomonadales bacterium]|nr:flagellar hook-length control protein FliK [Xanthomonadales bacterium]ODU95253.1 MAG: hypothetical protein ABT18_00570 [Rhodanobacter sp. SCN 66-43]OJY82980.1 MAG: hypothetical protein BGP23_07875 [Xanthomonadales bacterium 66-474]